MNVKSYSYWVLFIDFQVGVDFIFIGYNSLYIGEMLNPLNILYISYFLKKEKFDDYIKNGMRQVLDLFKDLI